MQEYDYDGAGPLPDIEEYASDSSSESSDEENHFHAHQDDPAEYKAKVALLRDRFARAIYRTATAANYTGTTADGLAGRHICPRCDAIIPQSRCSNGVEINLFSSGGVTRRTVYLQGNCECGATVDATDNPCLLGLISLEQDWTRDRFVTELSFTEDLPARYLTSGSFHSVGNGLKWIFGLRT